MSIWKGDCGNEWNELGGGERSNAEKQNQNLASGTPQFATNYKVMNDDAARAQPNR